MTMHFVFRDHIMKHIQTIIQWQNYQNHTFSPIVPGVVVTVVFIIWYAVAISVYVNLDKWVNSDAKEVKTYRENYIKAGCGPNDIDND